MDDFMQEADPSIYQNYQPEAASFGVPSDSAFGAAASGKTSAPALDTSALIEFNKKFREQGEAKDAKERDAKAQRKSAGKAQFKKLLAERNTIAEARKAKNRDDESQNEQAMLDSLQGESWSRVVSMIDVHAPKPEEGKKKGESAHATDRMRDVLISLKGKGLSSSQ